MIDKTGVERKVPMVEGPPLRDLGDDGLWRSLSEGIKAAENQVKRDLIWGWTGKAVAKPRSELGEFRFDLPKDERCKGLFLRRGPRVWRRMWVSRVLDVVKSLYPECLMDDGDPAMWVREQPDICVKQDYEVDRALSSRFLDFRPRYGLCSAGCGSLCISHSYGLKRGAIFPKFRRGGA